MKFAGGVRRITSTSHKDSDFNTILCPCQNKNLSTLSRRAYARMRICYPPLPVHSVPFRSVLCRVFVSNQHYE